jgi:hypothetical protein
MVCAVGTTGASLARSSSGSLAVTDALAGIAAAALRRLVRRADLTGLVRSSLPIFWNSC